MEIAAARLRKAGEVYAAALLENLDRTPLWRYSHATPAFFKVTRLPPYDGGNLYPCGSSSESTPLGAKPGYSYTWSLNLGDIDQKVPEAVELLQAEWNKVAPIRTPHTVAGAGYTHSFINFRRILSDGLKGYRARVDRPSPVLKQTVIDRTEY